MTEYRVTAHVYETKNSLLRTNVIISEELTLYVGNVRPRALSTAENAVASGFKIQNGGEATYYPSHRVHKITIKVQ